MTPAILVASIGVALGLISVIVGFVLKRRRESSENPIHLSLWVGGGIVLFVGLYLLMLLIFLPQSFH
jgi:hypothetical protein